MPKQDSSEDFPPIDPDRPGKPLDHLLEEGALDPYPGAKQRAQELRAESQRSPNEAASTRPQRGITWEA